jgi:myosin protein heavy chain
MGKLEAAEIARSKAARAEAFGIVIYSNIDQPADVRISVRRTLADIEKLQSETVAERHAVEQRLKTAEQTIRALEAKLDEGGRESSDLDILRQRLSEELEDERKQHLKDLADRDFTTDQTRKKYQG